MTDPSPDSLARAARRGDQEAFRFLVRKTYDRIFRWALARTGDWDEAEDVTQEVLVRLHRHLDSWEGRGSVLTWLYRITMNAAATLERRRREGRAAGSLLEAEPDATEPGRAGGTQGEAGRPSASEAGKVLDRVEAERALELVNAYVTELPPAQRQAFHLVDVEGLSAGEAAERLEVSASTVRVHLHRARAALRRRILGERPELAEGRG